MDLNRKTAFLTLKQMEEGAYSNIALNQQIALNGPGDEAFVRELVYGVLRYKMRLDDIIDQLVKKGLKGVKKAPLILLRLGLYQIEYVNSVPDYAAVSETVNLARSVATGRDRFINGVLRTYISKRDELPIRGKNEIEKLSISHSFEPWIVKSFIDQYGKEEALEILDGLNQVPRLSIRVNILRTTRRELRECLEAKGFVCEDGGLSERCLLVKGSGLLSTEEFKEGLFFVEDEASIRAVDFLAPKEGETVIDLCAAPGGKTSAMGELMKNKGKIFAFDVFPHKLELIDRAMKKSGIGICEIALGDGRELRKELVSKADKVLADCPCSGLGVIRRKPEIKYKDIKDGGKELSDLQYTILKNAGGYVKTGGFLMYSTCTINNIENNQVVGRFLRENPKFKLIGSRQFLPHRDGTDGFFACKMQRILD